MVGGVVGMLLLATAIWRFAPRAMLAERPSRFGLEETVSRLTEAAEAAGWTVSGVVELDGSKFSVTFRKGGAAYARFDTVLRRDRLETFAVRVPD